MQLAIVPLFLLLPEGSIFYMNNWKVIEKCLLYPKSYKIDHHIKMDSSQKPIWSCDFVKRMFCSADFLLYIQQEMSL